VALHESVHRGLEAVFGSGVKPILKQIYRTNPNVQENVDTRRKNRPDLSVEKATEEELADMSYENYNLSLVRGFKRLVAFINKWLKTIYERVTRGRLALYRPKESDVVFSDMMVAQLISGVTHRGLQNIPVRTREGAKAKASIAIPTIEDMKETAKREGEKGQKQAGRIAEWLTHGRWKWILTYGSTLGQMTEVLATHLPSVRKFNGAVRLMQSDQNKAIQEGSTTSAKWKDVESQRGKKVILDDLITETELKGLRPDMDLKKNIDGWGLGQYKTWLEAKAVHDKLVAKWESPAIPGDVQTVFKQQMKGTVNRVEEVYQALRAQIKRTFRNEEDRAKMLADLETRFKPMRAGRPYMTHKREGNYLVIVTDKEGGREVWGYYTRRHQKRAAEEHRQRFMERDGTEPRVKLIEKAAIFDNLDSADRGFVKKITDEIGKTITDEGERSKLITQVQQLYAAALPEMSGLKRLLPRKTAVIEGYSKDYRKIWGETQIALARYASKLKHMDDMKDALEDAGREAGKDKTIYAVTKWNSALPTALAPMETDFFASAEDMTNYVKELHKDPNITYKIHNSLPDTIMKGIKDKYYERLGKTAGDTMFAPVEERVKKNPTTVLEPQPKEGESMDDFTIRVSSYLNVLKTRYSGMLTHVERGAVSNFLVNLGFMNYLGWTPAFAFLNMTQVGMLTFPKLAARYGAIEAGKAITEGYKFTLANGHILKRLMLQAWNPKGETQILLEEFKGMDGKPLQKGGEGYELIKYLLDYGKLDFTQGSELSASTSDSWRVTQYAIKTASWLAHPTEVLNRLATAHAAYKLGKKGGLSKLQAREYALEVLDTTQLDYTPENKPIFLQKNWARIAFQFRQFSQQVAWQIGLAIHDTKKGLTEAQRKEARLYLTYLAASTFMMAGVRGMPAAGVIFLLLSLAMDDGEDAEFEFERLARETLGDDLGAFIATGMFSVLSIDAAATAGLGDLVPGTVSQSRASTSSKERLQDFAYDIAGPMAAWMGNAARGWDTYRSGDWVRGLEQASPKAVRTFMAGIRIADRGIETQNGLVRIAGTDLSAMDIAITMSGLKPSRTSWLQRQVNAVQAREDALKTQAKVLRSRYRMAYKYGDVKEQMRSMRRIEIYNGENPGYRITSDSLKGNALIRRQRITTATGGVASTPWQQRLYDDWEVD